MNGSPANEPAGRTYGLVWCTATMRPYITYDQRSCDCIGGRTTASPSTLEPSAITQRRVRPRPRTATARAAYAMTRSSVAGSDANPGPPRRTAPMATAATAAAVGARGRTLHVLAGWVRQTGVDADASPCRSAPCRPPGPARRPGGAGDGARGDDHRAAAAEGAA